MKNKDSECRSDLINKIKLRSKSEVKPQQIADAVLEGDINALSNAITLVESHRE